MRAWKIAVPLSVWVILNAVSVGLWISASRYDKESAWLSAQSAAFSVSEPFVAEGHLFSPTSATLTSPHQKRPCLAYRTHVDLLFERTDKKGSVETVRRALYDERHQVPDLAVRFDTGQAFLNVATIETFYQTMSQRLNDLPAYVPPEKMTNPPAQSYQFQVEEDLYRPDQAVFVAARVSAQGALEPHPTLGQLVVFPGSQAECVQAFASKGKTNRIVALAISAVSLLVCGLLWLAMRRS